MTHNYPEIKPAGIKAGDTIRFEGTSPTRAHEWIAVADRHIPSYSGTQACGGVGHYLLINRPAPPVVLPTEPTLGTLRWKSDTSDLDHSETGIWYTRDGGAQVRSESTGIPTRFVTAFTPVRVLADDETAVKTSALNRLRDEDARAFDAPNDAKNAIRRDAIDKFFTAVAEVTP